MLLINTAGSTGLLVVLCQFIVILPINRTYNLVRIGKVRYLKGIVLVR